MNMVFLLFAVPGTLSTERHDMPDRTVTNILFICMGNICRSPLAEGVFLDRIGKLGVAQQFGVDSAGTGGWHAGSPPDPRSEEVARRNGVPLVSRARQVVRDDFESFDLLIVMDNDNARELEAMGCPREKIRLLLSFGGDGPHEEVPDPYYGGADGFQLMYELIDGAVDHLLRHLTHGDPA